MAILTEQLGETLVITIDRAAKRNAIDRQTSCEIEAALNDFDADASQRVAVLTGAGGSFCAGSDLRAKIGSNLMPRGGEYGMIRRSRRKPLIAAVEGYAYGGGLEVAIACDLIVAAADAKFAFPEATRGTLAASGGVFRAHRVLPRNVATELLLTGQPLTAERAFSLGLVNRLTDTGAAVVTALELAREICRASPIATSAVLEIHERVWADAEDVGWNATAAAFETLQQGNEMCEGIDAFFAGRPPSWAPPVSGETPA